MAEMTEKQWLSGVQSSIIKELTTHKAALPAGFNQERFALNTVTVISEMLKDKKKKTELCKLTFESMAVCLCKAAYLGLDYFNGECYAIPYGGELNFQTDYKGEIKMCKRFSRNPIKDIFAKVVREDDFFTEEVDAGIQNVIYRPQPFSNKPMIGAFAIVVFKDGSMMYDTMSVEEIENVRNTYSKAKDSQAWKSSTGEMYKKTVLRRLCKLIDLDFDNIEQQKAYLAGGDVEFENGQPVFIDGRTATAALPDNGAPVDVFAQMEQAKKEPAPIEQPQPQETKEPAQQAIPFEQQQEEQPQPMPDGMGFMMSDESAMDADVVERGTNTDVYVFRVDNTKSISQSISTASLVTRVKVLGQADDDGNSPVEATVDGLTKYGIRQRIYTRGKDESLDEAKTAAQKIIDEDGVIDEEITVQAPDVPFIRKGDLVYVMIGSAQNYYYVVGIRHDCDNYSMTMDLELAKTETATQTTKKKDYNVGDIVNFKGGTHYVSSYSGSRGYSARAGKAKITIKNGSGKTHPWHLIHTDSGSNVYGWVDDGTFE